MKKVLRWFALLALLAFIAGVAMVFNPFSRDNALQPSVVTPEAVEVVQREVVLYFGDPAAPFLAQELRQIAECDSDLACLEAIVHELVRGPQSELVAVLPTQSLLLGVQIEDDTVWLDFNRALLVNHPVGSSSELLTVHALVNTIAANFPYLRKLVIQVDGVKIDTLRGHVDLRQPVVADFSLVRQELEVPGVEEISVEEISVEAGEINHE